MIFPVGDAAGDCVNFDPEEFAQAVANLPGSGNEILDEVSFTPNIL